MARSKSQALGVAITATVLAMPLGTSATSAMDVQVNLVTCTVSTTDGDGLRSDIVGKIVRALIKQISERPHHHQ